MPLTPAQNEAGIALYSALLEDRDDITTEIHSFLWELILPRSPEVESTMWTCPFQRWFAVHATKADGTFMSADPFGQLLAKMKYLIKSASMVEAYRRQSLHPQGIIGWVLQPSLLHVFPLIIYRLQSHN
jgi:hypothetical protein